MIPCPWRTMVYQEPPIITSRKMGTVIYNYTRIMRGSERFVRIADLIFLDCLVIIS